MAGGEEKDRESSYNLVLTIFSMFMLAQNCKKGTTKTIKVLLKEILKLGGKRIRDKELFVKSPQKVNGYLRIWIVRVDVC